MSRRTAARWGLAALLGVGGLCAGQPGGAAELPEPLAISRPMVEVGSRWPTELRGSWSQLTTARLTPQGRLAALGAMGAMGAMPAVAGIRAGTDARLLVRHVGGAAALTRAGLRAAALSNTVASVTASPDELGRLLTLPGVLAIDGEHRLRPHLDRSRALIGVQTLNRAGLGGRGVMIGLVDTGIDFRHADFRNLDGSTRVSYLLDGSTPRSGLHPELPSYQNMEAYTAADLNAVLTAEAMGKTPPLRITQSDIIGHGTHVLGIAASTGYATGMGKPLGRYVGMAAQATLCVVKGTRDEVSFADADLLAGVQFCFDRATDAKMPLVVNLSLGSPGGSHDGTSLLEVALDELVGDQPGRVVVVSAGNSGEVDAHASSALLDGLHEIPIHLQASDAKDPTGPSGQNVVRIEVFYDAAAPHTGEAGAVDLELKSPGGKVLKVTPGDSLQGRFDDEGTAIIDNSDVAMTGLRGAVVLITAAMNQTSIKAGDWTLRLRGRTLRYDAWLVEPDQDDTVALRGHVNPDSLAELPATAHSVIAVGALRSRLDWQRADGQLATLGRGISRVAPFSASGPSRDGRFVPDVLAPGEFVVSALSAAAPPTSVHSAFHVPSDPGVLIADDGVHGVLRGTSQAAPHVAGAVALLLELSPALTANQVRELLRTTTANDRAGGYGPRHGFGTVALDTALVKLRGDPAVLVSAYESDVAVNRDVATPQYELITVSVTPRDVRGVPLGPGQAVDIAASAGEWVGPVIDNQLGRYERILRPLAPRGTRITVTAHVAGMELSRHPDIYLVHERSEIGTPYVVGACTAAAAGQRTATGASGALVAAAALLMLLTRKSARARMLLLPLFVVNGPMACSAPESESSEAGRAALTTPTGPARRGKLRPGGDYFWRANDTLERPAIVIHLGDQRADIFDGEALVAQSSICTGRRSHKTPAGEYTILEKIPEHISGRYGDYVDERGQVVAANIDLQGTPPPAGTTFRGTAMPYFLRILGGIGMHAGPLPGYADSHGCIRFPEPVAHHLFYAAPLGTRVAVVE